MRTSLLFAASSDTQLHEQTRLTRSVVRIAPDVRCLAALTFLGVALCALDSTAVAQEQRALKPADDGNRLAAVAADPPCDPIRLLAPRPAAGTSGPFVLRLKVERIDALDNFDPTFLIDNQADFYPVISIDGQPKGGAGLHIDGDDHPEPADDRWTFRQVVSVDPASPSGRDIPITVDVWDSDGGLTFDDDHGDVSPAAGTRTLAFTYNSCSLKVDPGNLFDGVPSGAAGSASGLRTASPVTKIQCIGLSCSTPLVDHPSFGILSAQSASRLVACWTDGNTLGSFVRVAFSNDGSTWSTPQTIAGPNAGLCTVGGSKLQLAVTFVDGQNPPQLKFRTTRDGRVWSKPSSTVTLLGNLIRSAKDVSTTDKVLSAPYALVIPNDLSLRAIWQDRVTMSQVFFRDIVPMGPVNTVEDSNTERFLPGTGSCQEIIGMYQVGTSQGLFRYAAWSTKDPANPIFLSSVDLNGTDGYSDSQHPNFPRIGDYTGADCSSGVAWVAWTDMRNGHIEIYGARISLSR